MSKKIWLLSGLLLIAVTLISFFAYRKIFREPIKVGVLYSLQGTTSTSERPIIDAITMAIDEINAKGGLLGRKIKPVFYDGKSDDATFAQGAKYLLDVEKVTVIFGPWLSSSRKSVTPIIEQANSLLFYSTPNEGLESSKNIIYLGAAPNQALLPAVCWAYQNLGKRFYVVGSDDIYSRAAYEIIALQMASLGAEIVGKSFIPLGSDNVDLTISEILKTKPDGILNILSGSSNKAFFSQLRKAGIVSQKIPTISFKVGEPELLDLDIPFMVDDYAVANYFQTINSENNVEFIEHFKKRFGEKRVIGGTMEAAYDGVHLWAQAVQEAYTTETDKLLPHLKKQIFGGPGSVIYLDKNSNWSWRKIFIGSIRYDGQFNIVWNSEKEVAPLWYPPFLPEKGWQALVVKLNEGSGKK